MKRDHPYEPQQVAALDSLAEETIAGQIAPLPINAHDADYWQRSSRDFIGRPWTEVPFLWAESFFYRRLLDCVRFFDRGAWYWVDPFQPMKVRELDGAAVAAVVDCPDLFGDLGRSEVFTWLLRGGVLGNRADLGFKMGPGPAADTGEAGFDMLADDTDAIWTYVSEERLDRVVLLADNAGLELIMDLLLCDFLLGASPSCHVSIHLKPTPYYVSDATLVDALAAFRRLESGGTWARETVARLKGHAQRGLLTFESHDFYCQPEPYETIPPDLEQVLAGASLVIVKGDLNYRRLVGDVEGDPTRPFEDACAYFPAPVVALRTLKSDAVVGLDRSVASTLQATGSRWRTDGSHGVIQSRLSR